MRQFLMSGSVRGAARKGCPYRDCKVNLCILENSSSTPGKITETEYSEFSSEMRKTPDLDLNHFQLRNLLPNILIGTASGRNAGWTG